MRKDILKKGVCKVIACMLVMLCCITNCETYLGDEKEVVRVGVYQLEGYHAYNENGELEGYGIDYLKVLAAINGWTYEYVDATDFTDACKKFSTPPQKSNVCLPRARVRGNLVIRSYYRNPNTNPNTNTKPNTNTNTNTKPKMI